IHAQYGIAARGESGVRIETIAAQEAILEDSRGAAVNRQHHGVLLTGLVTYGISQEAFNIQTVGSLPGDAFGFSQRQLGQVQVGAADALRRVLTQFQNVSLWRR